jgi:hypothetical protein
MKKFFQGLVLGASLMYWYLHYSASFLAAVHHWLHHTASEYREDQLHEEADKALHGFLLQRALRQLADA